MPLYVISRYSPCKGVNPKRQREASAMGSKIRLMHELAELQREPLDNCSAAPVNGNIMHWMATIVGPEGTPYAHGKFQVSIRFPDDYPFKAPTVRLHTPIFHCNISPEGEICMDILKDQWSPALTVSKLLLSICSILAQPNPNDPLVSEIAELYITARELHDARARVWTERHAMRQSRCAKPRAARRRMLNSSAPTIGDNHGTSEHETRPGAASHDEETVTGGGQRGRHRSQREEYQDHRRTFASSAEAPDDASRHA